jgi:hypothetical protein
LTSRGRAVLACLTSRARALGAKAEEGNEAVIDCYRHLLGTCTEARDAKNRRIQPSGNKQNALRDETLVITVTLTVTSKEIR